MSRTLIALVEDKPGVLARGAGLVRRPERRVELAGTMEPGR